jgi:hypothetical protein
MTSSLAIATFAFVVDVPDDPDDPPEVEDLDPLDAAFSSSSFFFFRRSWASCPLFLQKLQRFLSLSLSLPLGLPVDPAFQP